jgi:hypothetical protein
MTTPLFTRLQLQSLLRKIILTHGQDQGLEIIRSAVEKELFRETHNPDNHTESRRVCEQSL